MKLSDLEHLVAVMRAKADEIQVADPNVTFYDDLIELLEALEVNPCASIELDPFEDCAKHIDKYVGLLRDFTIPLKIC